MSRLLLTLLALLSGLAAYGGEAQARGSSMGEAEVALLEALAAADCVSESVIPAPAPAPVTPVALYSGAALPVSPRAALHLAVYLKADRARE